MTSRSWLKFYTAGAGAFYDVGRLISLWVSAFEILVHPGGNERSNRDKVFELLEQIKYNNSQCAKKRFATGSNRKVERTLACYLYQSLHDRRNDFLHGNPIDGVALQLPNSKHNIFNYAAPLYRLALTAFFPLVFSCDIPLESDAEALGELIGKQSVFSCYQELYENALLTAEEVPPASGPA